MAIPQAQCLTLSFLLAVSAVVIGYDVAIIRLVGPDASISRVLGAAVATYRRRSSCSSSGSACSSGTSGYVVGGQSAFSSWDIGLLMIRRPSAKSKAPREHSGRVQRPGDPRSLRETLLQWLIFCRATSAPSRPASRHGTISPSADRNWFANRNPLVTRLPYVPVGASTSSCTATSTVTGRRRPRPRSRRTTTGLTLSDATFLMNHDVLQLIDTTSGSSEYVQINGDPTGTNTVTVIRGVAGTTATTSVASGSVVNLIGNSRNGGEVNQTGLSTIGTSRTQYCQTFQFPVQIGGSAQTARAQVMPGGIQSPFDFNMTIQLQNMVDDIENTCYYGLSQAPVDSAARPPR